MGHNRGEQMKHWKIEADDQTFDKVMDKALEMGLSILPGKVVQIRRDDRAVAFSMWLNYCGIGYAPTDFEEEVLPHGERVAYHLRLATLGRRAFGIC